MITKSSLRLNSNDNLPSQKFHPDDFNKKQIQAHRIKVEQIFKKINSDVEKKQYIQTWTFQSLSVRKVFQGIKFRMCWKDRESGFMIRLKLCTPKEIGGKRINLDSYNIQIQDSNLIIQKNQNLFYKQLQHYLDMSILGMLGNNKDVYSLSDETWIRRLLPKLGMVLRDKLKGKARVLSSARFIGLKKEKINEKYMLPPACSNFCWHPKGLLFLVQNQVPAYFNTSLLGNNKMINKIFPPQKIEKQISFDNLFSVQIDFENPYFWDVKQTFDFLDRRYEEIEELQNFTPRISINEYNNRYSRSFSMPYKPINQISDVNLIVNDTKDLVESKSLNLVGNLKLFRVNSELSRVQQELKELISEFSKYKCPTLSILQALVSPLCKNYENLVSEKVLGLFQIKIIEQLFKSTLKQNSFSTFVKCVMAETECNHSVIINAFHSNLVQLQAPPKYQDKMWLFYSYFLTFNDFDQEEFQDIFFMILQLYLNKLKSLETVKMEINNPSITDPFYVQSKNLVFINQIEYKKFIPDQIYHQMMRKFLSLYEVRMKNFAYIEYNKIMRIFSANQRIKYSVNFFNKFVNNKELMKSIPSLEYFLKEYMIEKINLKECKQNRKKRRSWKIQCLRCKQSISTNEVLQQKYTCPNCKHS